MIWFLLLVYVLPFVCLTLLVEAEWFGMATAAMLVSMGIYGFLHRTQVISYIKDHAIFCLEFIAVYLSVGVAWSFAKWLLFLLRFRREFRNVKAKFIHSLGLPIGSNIPQDKFHDFKNTLYSKGLNYLSIKPSAADSKGKIVAWMAFWPCSMIGYILNDPVRRLFNSLFMALKQSYQKMADHIVNDP